MWLRIIPEHMPKKTADIGFWISVPTHPNHDSAKLNKLYKPRVMTMFKIAECSGRKPENRVDHVKGQRKRKVM